MKRWYCELISFFLAPCWYPSANYIAICVSIKVWISGFELNAKSTLNNRKCTVRQISCTLNIMRLQYIITTWKKNLSRYMTKRTNNWIVIWYVLFQETFPSSNVYVTWIEIPSGFMNITNTSIPVDGYIETLKLTINPVTLESEFDLYYPNGMIFPKVFLLICLETFSTVVPQLYG